VLSAAAGGEPRVLWVKGLTVPTAEVVVALWDLSMLCSLCGVGGRLKELEPRSRRGSI
jgi:hypothetical protein